MSTAVVLDQLETGTPAESHPVAQNTICVVALFRSGSVEAAALFLQPWITWRIAGGKVGGQHMIKCLEKRECGMSNVVLLLSGCP